jgi:hypothetical protein
MEKMAIPKLEFGIKFLVYYFYGVDEEDVKIIESTGKYEIR